MKTLFDRCGAAVHRVTDRALLVLVLVRCPLFVLVWRELR